MATGPRYKVPFRRRREGRTNYHTRRKLIISKQPRLVTRKSLSRMQIQLVTAEQSGDKTHVSCVSTELKKYGYTASTSNTTAAYLTGHLMGHRMIKQGWKSAILDIGLYSSTKGSRIYAALKGVVDAGVDVPCDAKIFPDEARIRGEIAAKYNGTDITTQFESTLEKITSLQEERTNEQ